MINIIGGSYREIDYDDLSFEIYGSGFRATKFLLENKCPTKFNTVGNSLITNFLKENQKVYSDFEFECVENDELITFKYGFSLSQPMVFPNFLNIHKTKKIIADSDNIIAFGMLEAELQLKGSKVVYDPQTTANPKKFSEIGIADELIYIVNQVEAFSISSSTNIEEIKKYFFHYEKAKAFIIKNGPFGATLYTKGNELKIPSYVTENVFKIGSGDIFTSSFGYYWMQKGLSIEESAINASKSTAFFCDKKAYHDVLKIDCFEYQEFKNQPLTTKQVYLASPFFSISELILIDEIRTAFLSFGVRVFSPFHDVGIGDNSSISKKDLEGLENSDIIFCVLDNLDSGTLIESGYSLAKGKKIIGYHRTCDFNKLLMLNSENVAFFNHLTTAIYQTIWKL